MSPHHISKYTQKMQRAKKRIKYMDFFIENINRITGLSIPLLKIALPVGISFYTFQILSYTVDIYRGEKALKNPVNLATYIAMFPQLIAGPIVRYKDIASQINVKGAPYLKFSREEGKKVCILKHAEGRNIRAEDLAVGIRRFVLGLGKKVLLANHLGELCDIFRGMDNKTVVFYWIYAVAFSLHVYFDFS